MVIWKNSCKWRAEISLRFPLTCTLTMHTTHLFHPLPSTQSPRLASHFTMNAWTSQTRTHLHRVDGSLGRGSRQGSSNEPLMGLNLPSIAGQQLLILSEVNRYKVLNNGNIKTCTEIYTESLFSEATMFLRDFQPDLSRKEQECQLFI